MKRSKIWLKTLAYFLTALMLLQSCTVYRSTPVNVEQAAEQQLKAKVRTTDDKTFKFDYIAEENGSFYGIKFHEMTKKLGEYDQIPLNEEEISKILIQNKTASTMATVVVIAIPIVVMVVLLIENMSVGLDGEWFQ